MKKISFLFTGIALTLVSCKQPIVSNKDKLINKWVVQNAKIISPDTRGITDWDKDSLGLIIRAMENSFKGQVYELKSGDRFTTTGKLKTASGTWYEKDGIVSFMTDDYKQATWFFKNNKIEIGHDSSLIAMLELGVDSSYMQLTMKPAPGQAVKTDY